MEDKYSISMPPDVWGPIFWNAMHIVSLAYPANPTDNDKAGTKAFFESLGTVIPCPICREHYKEKIAVSPPTLNSKGELIVWAWEIHNQVNTMLNKPTMSMDAFLDRMKHLGRETTPSLYGKLAITGMMGIVVGATAIWAYHKYRKHI
jgi:hypothetical protein